jgi:antitoxin PrlF
MTRKGQVLIPKEVRDRTGLVPGKPVRVGVNERGEAVVMPETRRQSDEEIWAGIRAVTGLWKTNKSTDEIMRELRGDDPFI